MEGCLRGAVGMLAALVLLASVVVSMGLGRAPGDALRAEAPAAGPVSVPPVPARAGERRVLVWNVQRGSNQFDRGPEKVLAWIRAADPDIVLMQESYDIDGDRPTLGRWLAGELGWNAHQGESPHLCVLTRLEIVERFIHHPWHGVGARLRDERGRELIAWSCWLDWRAYTPYALRDTPDASDADLLANETEHSSRMAQARALLEDLRGRGHLPGSGAPPVPVLVGGDWNCPSHLDWTADAALVYRFRRELPLPVSRSFAESGLEDAWRVVHPCPVNAPGVTWTPLDRGTAERPTPADRIDRLYLRPDARGSLRAVAAFTLPRSLEPSSVPQADRLFPSDHGAVVVDFEVR